MTCGFGKRGMHGVCTPANLMSSFPRRRGIRGVGIRGVCTPASLKTFGSEQHGIRGDGTPANLTSDLRFRAGVGFVEYARLPT